MGLIKNLQDWYALQKRQTIQPVEKAISNVIPVTSEQAVAAPEVLTPGEAQSLEGVLGDRPKILGDTEIEHIADPKGFYDLYAKCEFKNGAWTMDAADGSNPALASFEIILAQGTKNVPLITEGPHMGLYMGDKYGFMYQKTTEFITESLKGLGSKSVRVEAYALNAAGKKLSERPDLLVIGVSGQLRAGNRKQINSALVLVNTNDLETTLEDVRSALTAEKGYTAITFENIVDYENRIEKEIAEQDRRQALKTVRADFGSNIYSLVAGSYPMIQAAMESSSFSPGLLDNLRNSGLPAEAQGFVLEETESVLSVAMRYAKPEANPVTVFTDSLSTVLNGDAIQTYNLLNAQVGDYQILLEVGQKMAKTMAEGGRIDKLRPTIFGPPAEVFRLAPQAKDHLAAYVDRVDATIAKYIPVADTNQ